MTLSSGSEIATILGNYEGRQDRHMLADMLKQFGTNGGKVFVKFVFGGSPIDYDNLRNLSEATKHPSNAVKSMWYEAPKSE